MSASAILLAASLSAFLKAARASGVVSRRLAERHDLCGQLGDQRLAGRRGPREQHAQAQVGQRELEQEEEHAAGGHHHARLHGEHQGRDREQAGDRAGEDLAAECGQPHHAGGGHHARASAAQLGADVVPGDGQSQAFRQVPACCQHQPPGARQLEVLSHGEEHTVAGWSRAGIAGRWRKEESESSARPV